MPPLKISPSQLATFGFGCERKWAFDKIDGLPRAPNRYAQFGTDMHTHRERWLCDGKPPPATKPEGRAALAGLAHLPKPGIALVERHVVLHRYAETDGIVYHGYVDAWWDAVVEHEHFGPVVIPVYNDHKSTGDLVWMKEPDHPELDRDFCADPQRITYGNALLEDPQYEHAPGAFAQWLYTERAKPHKTKAVCMYETREALAERMDVLHREVGLRIKQARGEPSSARPKNFRHCGAFGGCPYIETCHRNVTTRQKLRGVMAQSEVIKKLKERRAAAAAANGNDSKTSSIRDRLTKGAKRPGRDPAKDREKYEAKDNDNDKRDNDKKAPKKKTSKKRSAKAAPKTDTNGETTSKTDTNSEHQELGGAMQDLAATSSIISIMLDVPHERRRSVLQAATALLEANPND